MSWVITVLLWYAGIFVMLRSVNGYLRSQEMYHDLNTAIDKFHSPQYGDRKSDQNLQYYYLPVASATQQYYEEQEPIKRNQIPLQTGTAHSKIPITLTVPTLQKTYTIYFPNSYSVQLPKQETSEENPSADTSQEVNTAFYYKPSLQALPSPQTINPFKTFRNVHETKNSFEGTELNEASPIQLQIFEPELKSIFARPVNKIVHFRVNLPSMDPGKVQYSSPIEMKDSFNDDIDGSSSVFDDEKVFQYVPADTPTRFHNDNTKYITNHKLTTPLNKPTLPLEPVENVINREEFPPYTTHNSVVGTNQRKPKVMYITVRSSLGNSANGIADSRTVIYSPSDGQTNSYFSLINES